MKQMRYTGPLSNQDETAIVMDMPTDDPDYHPAFVYAQFDRLDSPYSHGWHTFPRDQFREIDQPKAETVEEFVSAVVEINTKH